MSSATPTLTHNAAQSRYEMPMPEGVALALYRDEPAGAERAAARVIFHTEVPHAARGQGAGGRLVRAVLEDISASGLKVVPRCPFVARYIAQHPEFKSLVR